MANHEPEQTTFAVAPLDRYAERMTVGLAYLGGLLMLPLLFAYLSNLRWGGIIVPSALAVPLALFLLLAYAIQPSAYRIEGEQLVITRRWWRALQIPFTEIIGVSPAITLADLPRFGLRFAFNPGIFGYQGPFHLAPYGRTFFLATNRTRLIAIARDQAPPLIISPANPHAFLEAINTQRGRSAVQRLEE